MKRRRFLHQLANGTAALTLPQTSLAFQSSSTATDQDTLSFGIVADVHKDLMPDADERLEKFIEESIERNVDFIIQLGDFCMAGPNNRDFLGIWETYEGPRYHVLGNHDMDGHSKQQMIDFWGMPGTYYSFDFQGVHFVVLDANFLYQDGKFVDYENANFYVDDRYRTYVNDEQIEWFKGDLESTDLNTVVVSHQSLWHYAWGIKNRLTLQKIMEAHQEKIICCLNGHNHIDFHHHQNGIDYLEINSMSYQWMREPYKNSERFPKELYEQYKWLPHLAPYKDPLYAFAEIDPRGSMTIEGVRSEWVYPSPYDMGMPLDVLGNRLSAEISDYELRF